ncbi:hypothetical protein E2C01_013574 [Portunus trituberculatus]|uniref:Uncharacterized protein n=1 Tax=Portunus trituberculatus TaxID=210409 RepID=A0A5B7DGM8_PORTR|nr:hypothetical protein [Portunus trituberculatus]
MGGCESRGMTVPRMKEEEEEEETQERTQRKNEKKEPGRKLMWEIKIVKTVAINFLTSTEPS